MPKDDYSLDIEMSSERYTELQRLIVEHDIGTESEFVNRAFTLFAWALEQDRNGKNIVAIENTDPNGELYASKISGL